MGAERVGVGNAYRAEAGLDESLGAELREHRVERLPGHADDARELLLRDAQDDRPRDRAFGAAQGDQVGEARPQTLVGGKIRVSASCRTMSP